MSIKDKGWWKRLKFRQQYIVTIRDINTLNDVQSWKMSPRKAMIFLALPVFISCILCIVLFTQTGLLKLMGPRPRSIIGLEYIELQNKVDSLVKDFDIREQQLSHLTHLITQVNIESSKGTNSESHTQTQSIQVSDLLLGPVYQLKPPIDGQISKEYETSQFHFGIDLTARQGTPVVAINQGLVLYSGFTQDNGWTIAIAHPDLTVSAYKHMNRVMVMVGQYVRRGEPIAIIGNTGEKSTGPHLHFEMWRNNQLVDPLDYIIINQ